MYRSKPQFFAVYVYAGLEPADSGRLPARRSAGRHLAAGVGNTVQHSGTKQRRRQSNRAATTASATASAAAASEDAAATATWRTVGTTEVGALWRLFRPVVKTPAVVLQ